MVTCSRLLRLWIPKFFFFLWYIVHAELFETLHRMECKGQTNFCVLCMRCSVINQKWCLTEQLAHALCGWNVHPQSDYNQIRGLAWYQICLRSLSRIVGRVCGWVSLLIFGKRSDAYQKLCFVSAPTQTTKMGSFWRSAAAKVSLQYCNCSVNRVSLVHCCVRYTGCMCTANNEFLNF